MNLNKILRVGEKHLLGFHVPYMAQKRKVKGGRRSCHTQRGGRATNRVWRAEKVISQRQNTRKLVLQQIVDVEEKKRNIG